jgi:hypothetical protein
MISLVNTSRSPLVEPFLLFQTKGWDTRGTNNSFPHVELFPTDQEELRFWNNSIPGAGLQASSRFQFNQEELEAFYAQVDAVDTKLWELGKKYYEVNGDILQYIGTAATVRDMVALADYLSPSLPINFWAFSYATSIS